METPTLTKKQIKSTLSSKKKKKKKQIIAVKNVLATPYDNYCPLVSTEDQIPLYKILKSTLPMVKPLKFNVPWSKLKGVPKEERKHIREQHVKEKLEETGDLYQIDEIEKTRICIGINDVSKHLESDLLSAVLISCPYDLTKWSSIMVQHLIDQSVMRHVPVLLMPDLKYILLNKCGIYGAAVGIKKTASLSTNLSKLVEFVSEMARKYPVPETHTVVVDEIPQGHDVVLPESENDAKIDEDEIRRLYYLKRESKDVRAFVPKDERNDATGRGEVMKVKDEGPPRKKFKRAYVPLKVKRVKGDPNRMERIRKKVLKNE